ncbi:MAG: dipeptide epimerase [Planctomycetaceae bacterium]|jgi:L-alanine-DL-glutamate epimerase-like enolase superfamily enzyme|nr:dipeptide epimerase [Planctomycetaceae bacterium]
MNIKVIRVDLPVKHVLTYSRGSISVARAIVVELEQDGLRGHGEVQENPHYNITVEELTEHVLKIQEMLEDYAMADPVSMWRYLNPVLSVSPYAQSAVDMAACDLWGKIRNKPLWYIWRLRPTLPLPKTCFTIGIDTIDQVIERFHENPNWPIYKIKLGGKNDMQMVRELRKLTNAVFRVDVNGMWNVETTLHHAPELKELGVEFIEQPLSPEDWEGMEILKNQSPLPIMADESCASENDIDRCAEYFFGINAKPCKFGGLTPMRHALDHAKEKGLKILLGCGIESTIAISASAQFASLADYLDLDGPQLIEKKVGTGVCSENGELTFPDENGTGVCVLFR